MTTTRIWTSSGSRIRMIPAAAAAAAGVASFLFNLLFLDWMYLCMYVLDVLDWMFNVCVCTRMDHGKKCGVSVDLND